MSDAVRPLEAEVDIRLGEKLELPQALVDSVGPGRWRIILAPAEEAGAAVRRHSAFLSGYAAEDEGLYEDDPDR